MSGDRLGFGGLAGPQKEGFGMVWGPRRPPNRCFGFPGDGFGIVLGPVKGPQRFFGGCQGDVFWVQGMLFGVPGDVFGFRGKSYSGPEGPNNNVFVGA